MDITRTHAAKAHWKRFFFAWAWPFLLLSLVFMAGHSKYPRLIFCGIFFPVFPVCNYIASKLLRDRQTTIAQGMWWIGAVPILIWVVVIFGTFGFARLIGAS
jgi:hypothetical protein